MEYHKTKDISHVKQVLGARAHTVRVAKTLREDEELLKARFEYVTG